MEGSGIDDIAELVADVGPDHGSSIRIEGSVARGTNGTVYSAESSHDYVMVQDGNRSVGISLPTNVPLENGESASNGTVVNSSTESEDSGVVLEALQDGSVQLQAIISGPDDVHDLTYRLKMPIGATAMVDDGGAVIIVGADGEFIGGLATPWARDSAGSDIATFFTVSGNIVTQHVERQDSAVYPIVADPWLGIALIDKVTKKWFSGQGYRYYVYPSIWGRGGAGWVARKAGWGEAKSKGVPDRATLKNRFYCHYDYRPITTFKGSWNLESWRPDKGYWSFMRSQCN